MRLGEEMRLGKDLRVETYSQSAVGHAEAAPLLLLDTKQPLVSTASGPCLYKEPSSLGELSS
jgi:hypothetical protein